MTPDGGSGATSRLIAVTLDEGSILRWNAEIEHERRVAIADLLEDNRFRPVIDVPGGYEGPYRLHLRTEEGRLAFDLADDGGGDLVSFRLALSPFRRVVKDYFSICESYYAAVRQHDPRKIEAIDMGRRALHNEGSALLQKSLAGKVEVDLDTARRLFTLICVLHLRL